MKPKSLCVSCGIVVCSVSAVADIETIEVIDDPYQSVFEKKVDVIFEKYSASNKNGAFSLPYAGNQELRNFIHYPIDEPVDDSWVGEPSPEVGANLVVGTDDRKKVTSTVTYPYSAVVYVSYSYNGIRYSCTGALVGSDTVLTAGHCVHSGGESGVWHSDVRVYPGRDYNSNPFGSCTATNLMSVQGWTVGKSYDYDIGAIKLNCNIGNTVGWLGYFWSPNLDDYKKNTILIAYHGDLDSGQSQWYTWNYIYSVTETILRHEHDLYQGASGGSIIYENYPQAGFFTGGIQSFENLLANANRAVRINESLFNQINYWKSL